MSLHGFQSAIIDKTKHRPVKLKNIQPLCILMCILTIPEIAHAAKFDHKAVFTSPCLDIMTSSIPDPDLTKFTVCTYIKLASSDPWTAFTYQLPNSSVYEFGVFGDSSSLTIWMFGTQINVIEKLNLQTWYEICIMWDGDSKSMGFYLDGTQKVRRKLENNHKLAGGGGVFLGCPQNKEANSSISVGLVGEIYMFRMWNSVQSSLLQTCKDGTVIQWKTEKWIYYTNVIQRDSTLHCAKEQEYSSMSGQINNIIHLFHKRSLGEISSGVRQPAEGVTSRPSLVLPNVSPTISSTTGTKVLTSGMNTISVVETTNITNVTGFTIGTSRSKTIWTSSSLNNENDTFTNSSTFSTSSFTTTMNNGTSSWSTGITSKRTYVTSEFSQTTNVVNNETFTTPSISSDMAAGSMNCSMNDTLAAETWLLDICKSSCDYGSAYEIILNENCTEEESKLKLKLTILNFNYFGKNCKVLVLNNTAINDCDLWKRSSSGINIQGVNRIDYYCCCSEECPSPNCIMSKRICLTDGTGVTKGFSSTVLDNSDLTIGVTVNNRTGMTDYSGASTTSTKGSSTMINSTSLTTLSIVSNSSVGIGLSTDSILNTTLKGEVTLTGNGQSKTTPNSESTPSNGGSNATHSHGTTASADSESNTTADQATMTTINGTANTGSDITGNSGHTPSADSGSRTTANSESTRTTNSGSNSTYNPGRTTTVNNGFSTAGNSESTRTTNSGSNSTYNPGRTTTVNNGFSTAGNSESTRTTNSGSNSTYNPGRTTTINDGFSTAGDGGVNITAGGDTWTRNTTVNTGSTTTSQSGSKTTYTYNHTVTISGGSSSSDNVTNSPNTTDSSKNVTIILPGPDDLNSSAIDRILSQLESMLRGEVSVSDAQAMLNTLDVLLSANQTLLGPVANSLIKVVDTIGLQLAFPGNNISLTSNFLALAVEKVNVSSFTGTSFGVDSSSGLQVSWGAQAPGNSDGSVLLPASVISQLSPDEKKNASRVQFNYYAKTSLFMDSSLTTKQLVSKVISSSVSNLSISNLTESIVVTLKTSPTNSSNQVSCVFWDFNRNNGSGGWSSEGCSVAKTTRDETVCKCNHLTSFAILMNVSPNAQLKPEDLLVLTFITYIGCGLSAIFLSVTLVTYIAFEKIRRDYPSKILIQLCAALVCLNLTFLLNPWIALYNDIPGLCISVAAFLHYFVLVSITWMGLEAFHMYLSLVKVFNTYVRKYILKFCIVGWGVPAVVVAIILAVNKDLYSLKISGKYPNGSTDYFCWVNDTVFWVTVVGYFAIIFLLNVSMFVVVLIQLCRIKKQKQLGYQRKTTLQDLRSVAGITFLLGITWGLGFFSFGPGTTVVMFLFTIFNSLQGFFIFFFYCVAKENVRKQWRRYLCCGKFRLAENSDWSKTATNKLRKQTSKQGVSSSSSNSIQSSSNTNSTTLLVSSEYSLHPNGNGNVLKERNGVSFMLQNGEMPLQEMAARASTKNGNVKQNSLRRTSNRGSVHFIDQI